jgi:hypothetical protein
MARGYACNFSNGTNGSTQSDAIIRGLLRFIHSTFVNIVKETARGLGLGL